MKTKHEVEYVVDVGPAHNRTPRKCAVCGDPASRQVVRAVKGHKPVMNTLRFACARHATLEKLYPQAPMRSRNIISLPHARRGYGDGFGRTTMPTSGIYARDKDQSMFYRDVMREMGGVVPMPDRPTKAELAEDGKRLARRHTNWSGPVITPEAHGHKYRRHYRQAGMSGRQWVKFRKQMGLARTAR